MSVIERINLNTANRAQLMTVEGIDASRADAILSWREANGDFGDVEELCDVPGFDHLLVQKVRGQVNVGEGGEIRGRAPQTGGRAHPTGTAADDLTHHHVRRFVEGPLGRRKR